MSHIILGLCGKKLAGKTVVAKHLVDKHGFVEVALAEPMKEIIGRQLFYLTTDQLYGDKKEVVDERWGVTPRYILQRVGTEMFRREFGSDFWAKRAMYRIGELIAKYPNGVRVVVSDCRFKDEVNMVELVGGVTCRVIKEGQVVTDEHESENALNEFEANFTISAAKGDLEAIYKQADRMIERLESAV